MTTRQLSDLTVCEAVDKLNDWQSGRSGGFVTALFNLMTQADYFNLAALEKAFPNMVYVFRLWRNGDIKQ
jgi:hypothetical protein